MSGVWEAISGAATESAPGAAANAATGGTSGALGGVTTPSISELGSVGLMADPISPFDKTSPCARYASARPAAGQGQGRPNEGPCLGIR